MATSITSLPSLASPHRVSMTAVELNPPPVAVVTRRFGIGAGLASAAALSIGVYSEQIKTRRQIFQQEANIRDVEKQKEEEQVEVVLPNGIRYYDMRVGTGDFPQDGDLVTVDLKGQTMGTGEVFVDTFKDGEKKPLALVAGSRPYSKGVCEGIECGLRTMRAGGIRRVIIPPLLGFGEKGADFGSGIVVSPNATLVCIIQLDTISVVPT